ncbi:GNAT family N-acetyltransferase [Microvirga arabica]|uniref:GNAT family N-acetyltransferase n=1 Tax=Microvirga arabica TaxID=1128671 RepID=A0ABV6YCD1_9HYPH
MNLALKVESLSAIRPVRDSDRQDLFGLIAICYADYPGCFVDPHDDLPDLRAPSTSYDRTGGAFWAVEDERGRVCACVAVDFPESGTAELHRLYVRPDQRGMGLGLRLVHQAEAHARSRGASRMVLWSDTRFVTAHRLYTRLGYRQLPEPRQLTDISGSVEYGFEKDALGIQPPP